MVEFRAELETSGGNAAGFGVPQAVVDELGGGGHPKMIVRVNGYEFRRPTRRPRRSSTRSRSGLVETALRDVLDNPVGHEIPDRIILGDPRSARGG